MKISYGARGLLMIDEARICFRNFAGRKTDFNSEGDRNFNLIIPNIQAAEDLLDRGWTNIRIVAHDTGTANDLYARGFKYVKVRDGDPDDMFITMPVKVSFDHIPPTCYLKSGARPKLLTPERLGVLDKITIANVDLDIAPRDWAMHGKEGRTAYLRSIEVTQDVDRFAARYAEEEYPGEEPPF